jgi:hypothetical protein
VNPSNFKDLRWLKAHGRFHRHFTATSSSWLNLVERFLGELTSKRGPVTEAFSLCANWFVLLNPTWKSATKAQRDVCEWQLIGQNK